MQHADLWNDVVRACGAKRLAAAIGRHLATIYRWAEGENGLLDWWETTINLLALRPGGRPVLIRLQAWSEGLFRRALCLGQQSPISTAALRRQAVLLLRETADVIECCGAGEVNRELLLKDAVEVKDLVERIIASVEAGVIDEEEEHRPPLRAAR